MKTSIDLKKKPRLPIFSSHLLGQLFILIWKRGVTLYTTIFIRFCKWIKFLKSKQMAFETFLPYERNCFTHVRRTNVSVQYCFNASCTLLIIDFALMLYIYLHQLILWKTKVKLFSVYMRVRKSDRVLQLSDIHHLSSNSDNAHNS